MFEFNRSFGDTVIRMFSINGRIIYSAYDVASALGLRDKRGSVNKVIKEEKGDYLNRVQMGSDSVLFMSKEYIIGLTLKAEDDIKKDFLKWMIEVQDVSRGFKHHVGNESDSRVGLFATTQIAKSYGLSAKVVNQLLHDEKIQHKVNDQWVLYSKYQSECYTQTVKVRKLGYNDEIVLHTYWTEKGVEFIQGILDKFYQRQSQLSLF